MGSMKSIDSETSINNRGTTHEQDSPIRFGFRIVTCDASDPVLTIEGESGLSKGQHIVFVTSEEYYRSEEGMSMFAKIMARHHGDKCTVLFSGAAKSSRAAGRRGHDFLSYRCELSRAPDSQ
jgi:hypothetical protein